MKPPKLFEGLTLTERRTISSAFILIFFLVVFVNVYDFSGIGSSENQIGKIQEMTNNTRVKSNQRVLWQNARESQSVHIGDKIFTGTQSTAKISLGRQGSFNLGENSLVEFQTVNREKIANFKSGTYRLFSNGKLKIAINGKVAEIDAKNSEFEVVVSGTNSIQIKTVKGSGQIKISDKITLLKENVVIKPMIEPTPKTRTVAHQAADIAPFTVTYTPRLYDEYAREGGALQKRTLLHRVVQKSVRLPFPTASLSQEVILQHGPNEGFSSSYEHKTFGYDKKIKKVFLGDNFWRYKTENEEWSNTYRFTVNAEYPPHSKPELHFANANLFLVGPTVEGAFNISTPYAPIGYIVETSRSGNFSSDGQISWQKTKTATLRLSQTGPIFFRARTVDKEFQLGEWSETHSFNVARPPELQPIELKLSAHGIRVGESIFARWNTQDTIKKYRLDVLRGSKKVLSIPLQANSSDWFPKTPGTYSMQVFATDEFGRPAHSNIEDVKVAEPIVLAKTIEPVIEREPTAAEPVVLAPGPIAQAPVDITTVVENMPTTRNYLYTHSFLTLSTSHFNIQSKPLNDASSGEFAQSVGLNVDYLYWMNNHGLQAILQKSLVQLGSGIGDMDVLIGEARYRYRILPRNLNVFMRSFQLTSFIGYEFYRNNKDTYFLSSYSLPKLGLTFDIPMFDRFVMSALATYGAKSGAIKYEAGWDLTYFLQKRMGVGFGYKLSFVEFDLTSEFPGYAPYREGYAQGTLNFKYFF